MDTIIFDVDDTLYDQALPFKNACEKIITRTLSEQEVAQLYIASRKHSDALFDKWQSGQLATADMHTYRITAACQDLHIEITEQQAIDFQEAYVTGQKSITLFGEVKQLLDLLSNQGKQLAVLTNGEPEHQSMKIRQLGLTNWIAAENLFISGAVGHAKPSIEVFSYIENKLGLDKSKTVYIGDSFENDVVGAKQAGWYSIWMNHRNREALEGTRIKADRIVYSAKELLGEFLNPR
ncbi:HAD family hydrolase [Radiobacillus sp. PE A8.2]|uniref:HAD family hydrolase n=1 Tax=Radiobacillus sp. PE A8.2 TaxID=3380349 RepID=UPI0038908CAF